MAESGQSPFIVADAISCEMLSGGNCNRHTSAQMVPMHPLTGEEHMIGKDLDFDLHNAIQELIAERLLEENASAHSVARLVIHDGYDSLTPAQRALYDAVVASGVEEASRGN
jgi:hypothetical protein